MFSKNHNALLWDTCCNVPCKLVRSATTLSVLQNKDPEELKSKPQSGNSLGPRFVFCFSVGVVSNFWTYQLGLGIVQLLKKSRRVCLFSTFQNFPPLKVILKIYLACGLFCLPIQSLKSPCLWTHFSPLQCWLVAKWTNFSKWNVQTAVILSIYCIWFQIFVEYSLQ